MSIFPNLSLFGAQISSKNTNMVFHGSWQAGSNIYVAGQKSETSQHSLQEKRTERRDLPS